MTRTMMSEEQQNTELGSETRRRKGNGGTAGSVLRFVGASGAAVLLLVTAYDDLIVTGYWPRMYVLCACLVVFGFLMGYGTRTQDHSTGWTALMFILPLWLPAAHLAGIFRLPVGERYPAMVGTHYLMTLLILASVPFGSYSIAWAVFRRRHPDKAFRPSDEEEEPREMTPMDTRTRNWIIAVAITVGLIAAFLAYNVMRSA